MDYFASKQNDSYVNFAYNAISPRYIMDPLLVWSLMNKDYILYVVVLGKDQSALLVEIEVLEPFWKVTCGNIYYNEENTLRPSNPALGTPSPGLKGTRHASTECLAAIGQRASAALFEHVCTHSEHHAAMWKNMVKLLQRLLRRRR